MSEEKTTRDELVFKTFLKEISCRKCKKYKICSSKYDDDNIPSYPECFKKGAYIKNENNIRQ